jgi:invasin D
MTTISALPVIATQRVASEWLGQSPEKKSAHAPEAGLRPDVSEALADDILKRLLRQELQASSNALAVRTAASRLGSNLDDPAAEHSMKIRLTQMLVEQLASGKLSGQLTRNAAQSGLDFLSARCQVLAPEHRDHLIKDLVPVLVDRMAAALSRSGIDNPIGARSSFDDILDGLQGLIGIIKEEYLDVYARMVEAYAQLFAELNEEVIGKLHLWLNVVGDKGAVQIDARAIRQALDDLITQYSLPNPDAVLFPVPGEDGSVAGSSREDAMKWLVAMGLPVSCLKRLPDGSYCVVLDLSPLREMKEGVPSGANPELLPARFQAWQAAWNAQIQELESALQKHTQKYSNANSIHDNVQKVISSTLSALFEMLKAFSASLG